MFWHFSVTHTSPSLSFFLSPIFFSHKRTFTILLTQSFLSLSLSIYLTLCRSLHCPNPHYMHKLRKIRKSFQSFYNTHSHTDDDSTQNHSLTHLHLLSHPYSYFHSYTNCSKAHLSISTHSPTFPGQLKDKFFGGKCQVLHRAISLKRVREMTPNLKNRNKIQIF